MNIVDLLDRPIAFQRPFVTITGSVTAALMLSQAVYWSKRASLPNGWFWKTQVEWEEETGLSRREQEAARKTLKKHGILEENLRGVPAKMHFRINEKNLSDLLKSACKPRQSQYGEKRQTGMAESAKLDCTKQPNKNGEKRQTITENTSEITSKIKADILPELEKPEKPTKPQRQLSTKLPENWHPSLEETAFIEAERPDLDIEKTAETFRLHYMANAKRLVDWSAAWKLWVMGAPKSKASPWKQNEGRKYEYIPSGLIDDFFGEDSVDEKVVEGPRVYDSPATAKPLAGELILVDQPQKPANDDGFPALEPKPAMQRYSRPAVERRPNFF